MIREEAVRDALAGLSVKTRGVVIGSEIRVGRDHTDDEAVWIYVVVPDDRIEEFHLEWDDLRDRIRERVREKVDSELLVYSHLRAASETPAGS